MREGNRYREGLGIVALALAAVATGVICVLAYRHTYATPSANGMPAGALHAQHSSATNGTDQATGLAPSPAAASSQTISVLADTRPVWLRRPVASGQLNGYELGAVTAKPGADSQTIDGLVSRTAGSDWVIVQAGIGDIINGATPSETVAGVKSVVTDVRDSGPSVIVALVPPSDTEPADVLTVNMRLQSWASKQRIGVLDTFSPLADPDGTYRSGLSDDGVHANSEGAKLTTLAAARQLPSLLG